MSGVNSTLPVSTKKLGVESRSGWVVGVEEMLEVVEDTTEFALEIEDCWLEFEFVKLWLEEAVFKEEFELLDETEEMVE